MASIAESIDFTSNALNDNSITVTRTPITKTIDTMGEETLTEGTSENISAIFSSKINNYTIEKYGLLKSTEAYLMVGGSQTINKDDKIEADSEVYRVVNVRKRGPVGSVTIYKFCELERIEV